MGKNLGFSAFGCASDEKRDFEKVKLDFIMIICS